MLKLYLPPNLKAAAERDAIAVKLEADLSRPPSDDFVLALALLQRWCGSEKPPPFLQLRRSQMEQLVQALYGMPAFFLLNDPLRPLPWIDGRPEGLPPPQAAFIAGEGPAAQAAPAPEGRMRPLKKAPTPEAASGVVEGSEHFLCITLPSREHRSYGPLLELLKLSGFSLETSNRKWWLRDRHKTLRFLSEYGSSLREEWGLNPTENFKRNCARIKAVELACSVEEGREGSSLTLALRAGNAKPAELNAALESGQGYVEDQGDVYLIDASLRRKLRETQRALSGDAEASLNAVRSFRIKPAQIPEAHELIGTLSPNFQAPREWIKRSEALHSLGSLRPASVPAAFDALLRPYQRLGLAWLCFLREQGLGGILADEMGLGKTLQALGLILSCSSQDGGKTCLVVAPASLLENWRREAARFAPGLRVFVHHGEQRLSREAVLDRIDLVITSYGTLTRDRDLFSSIEFPVLIADEAQHIKNRRSQNAQALRSLRAATRFLLTGTPLENSLDDLRSLFEFLLPGYLSPQPSGLRAEQRAWHDERLLARTAPYLLRRTKAAVAGELPPKIEMVTWCDLLPAQADLYERVRRTGENELIGLETKGASEAQLRFAMLSQLLRLRQICCDPRLVRLPGLEWPGETTPEGRSCSAKTSLLRELLDEAIDDGHRVLLFSQFTSMLDILGKELEQDGIPFCRLDGSMTTLRRQEQIDRFQSSPDLPVFLLSLKAGGVGLNLTGADTVIHFDPWWNPAAEVQATDRAHRIGQTRAVTSYKLICSGTVEEKVLALQEHKRALLAQVFEASDEVASRLSLTDLRDLLT